MVKKTIKYLTLQTNLILIMKRVDNNICHLQEVFSISQTTVLLEPKWIISTAVLPEESINNLNRNKINSNNIIWLKVNMFPLVK